MCLNSDKYKPDEEELENLKVLLNKEIDKLMQQENKRD